MTDAKRSCRYDDDRDGICIRHPDGCPYEEPFDADAHARERAFLAARVAEDPPVLYGVPAVPDAGPTLEECRAKFAAMQWKQAGPDDPRPEPPSFDEAVRSLTKEIASTIVGMVKAKAKRAQFGVEGCRCGCSDGRRVR